MYLHTQHKCAHAQQSSHYNSNFSYSVELFTVRLFFFFFFFLVSTQTQQQKKQQRIQNTSGHKQKLIKRLTTRLRKLANKKTNKKTRNTKQYFKKFNKHDLIITTNKWKISNKQTQKIKIL